MLYLTKFTNSIKNKTTTLFLSLIVSILFSVVVSQGAYAISSEYLNNGNFETIKFAGPSITNLGFDNKIINNGGFGHPGSSNQPISLASLDAMNTTEAVVDNNIYKVWSDNLSGNNEIFIAVSTDGGKSFKDPKNISNNPGSSENPAIAVSGNAVYVVWSDNTSGNNEILFIKSTDAGANFTDQKNISNNPGSSENPAIAVSRNAVHVVWSDNISENRPDCSSAKANPAILSSPNHAMMPINIVGVTDPDGDTISIKVDTITQDEPTKRNNGDPAPDGDGIGTSIAQVRAEREGGNDGRVYEIHFTASDSSGATCSGSVDVKVPKGNQAIDSGQKYDSTKVNQLIDNNIQNLRSDSTPDNNEILFVKSTDAGANFTVPKNISNNPGSSENPAIAVSGNAVYVVWSDNTSGNNEILFVKSTNAGDNFTIPDNISNNPGSSENPAIAVSGNAVYVAWSNSASNSEILFIKSTDAGANFTDPENISNNAGTSENPVITVSGNTVYVVWIDTTSGNNQVPIVVSENGGENFSAPQIISNNADDISNLQITINGDNVSITWIDNSSGTNKILIAESTDGGDSFSAPKTVSNNPYVYVTWIEDNGNTGEMDAFIAVSNNNGTSFNTTKLSIEDPNGPTFAGEISDPVVFGNSVYVTWIEDENANINEEDVFIAVSDDNGQTFNTTRLSIADPNGPTAAFNIKSPVVFGNKVYVTWTEAEDANTSYHDAFIAVSNDAGQTFDTKRLSNPDPNGPTYATSISEPVISGDNVYVTWTEDEDSNSFFIQDVFIAVSNDNGATFKNATRLSIPDPSGPTAVSGIGVSKLPVISGDNVYVTWIEDEYAGTDRKDAFIAVSNDNGTSFNTTKLSIVDENGPTNADRINNPVVSGDNVYVTWIEDENSFTNKNDIFIAVSNDNGVTFNTTKLSITDPNGPTDDENHHNLDVLPVVSGNNVYITWLEEEEAGSTERYDAFIAVSNNTGQTFNTTRLSIPDPDGPTSADHITNPVVSGNNVYTTWIENTNASTSNQDAFIAVSNDAGKTFKTQSLSIPDPNGDTNIESNVGISPAIISGSNVYVTWNEEPDTRTQTSPFIAVSNNTGQTFETKNLSIIKRGEGSSRDFDIKTPVVSGSGVYVTWIERYLHIDRERDAFIGVSNDKGVTFHTTNLSKINPDGGTSANNIINDPVVSGDNIYVTWREVWRADKDGNINLAIPFISVSNNNGITFNTEGLSMFGPENTKANARSIGNPVVP
jgi:hypothetical protein